MPITGMSLFFGLWRLVTLSPIINYTLPAQRRWRLLRNVTAASKRTNSLTKSEEVFLENFKLNKDEVHTGSLPCHMASAMMMDLFARASSVKKIWRGFQDSVLTNLTKFKWILHTLNIPGFA
jgi:hypothetical protein